ncbi:hypothetical protein [Siphonobacter sp. SORGH_AS_0500]|uniref:hypothetical protein n=1 Tax=Siphonobacter sp. SORGH_AS_0500 TaxID=1864824 RepID=UPI002867A2FB|nr:hypothetical protein [Siphonobacter sp. SORGH_AS_0500]MDR6196139.1 hypothetical protein [Siphonobacter sp. SORGH_AS_0500]
MSQLQSNLTQNWNRYLVVIALIALAILKNRNVLTAEDVINIQYALYTLGIMPSNPRTIFSRSRKVAPFLLLFFLFYCKPKTDNLEKVTRDQLDRKLQNNHEKIVDTVATMPKSTVDRKLADDNEFLELWDYYSKIADPANP